MCCACVSDVRCVLSVCGGVLSVCGVCCLCGAAWHEEKKTVCRFKTSPCVRFKTLPCVPAQRAHVVQHARRFARTHGSILNLHTETF